MGQRQPSRSSSPAQPTSHRPMRIAMLAFPNVQVLDVMGPLEVFSRTSRWLCDHEKHAGQVYSVEIIGLKRGHFLTSSGLRLHAERSIADVGGGIDTLMIAGGLGVEQYRSHVPLLEWIRRQSTQV